MSERKERWKMHWIRGQGTSCAKLRILEIILFMTLFMHVISLLYTGLSWLRLITTFAIATNNPQAVVTN